MATLNGKPVQWMQGPGGQLGWRPFETEGQMARAKAASPRPEGAMATLGGKPVQWMQGPGGQMGWQPFETEGQMARAQAGTRPAPSATLATLSTPPERAQLEERNRMLQQAGGANISQRLVPTEAQAQAINRRYASPEYWQSDAGKSMLALADGDKASEKSSLADLYEAQRAVGIGARDEIVSGLTAGLDAQKAEAIKTWATANPALALREFQKRFPKGEATTGPDPAEGSPRPLPAGTAETTAPIEFPEISYQSAPAPYAPGGVVAAPFTQQETKVPVLGGDDGLPVVAPVNSQKFNLAGPDSPLPQINDAQALTERKTNELLLQHLAPLRMGGAR